MRLTSLGRGVAFGGLIVAVCGIATGMATVVAVGSMLLAFVAVAASVVVEAPNLDLTRRASATDVDRGTPVDMGLVFTSVAKRPSGRLAIIETVNRAQRAALLDDLAPQEAREMHYGIDTSRRGLVVAGPLSVRRTDPFGLVTADREFGGTVTISVRPRRFAIRMLPLGRQRDLEGPTREQSAGSATFHRLREYVEGDDLRRVHWRTSARTGQLMVKHMVDTTRPEMVVVVDNRASVISVADFEHAVEVAASVLWAADTEGFPASLYFTGSPPSTGSLRAHLDELTVAGRSTTDSLIHLAHSIEAHGRSLMIVTGTPSVNDVEMLATLSRHFSPVYIVSMVADRNSPLLAPPGATALECVSAEDFVAQWDRL